MGTPNEVVKKTSILLKIYYFAVTAHLGVFLDRVGVGMAKYAEQTCEAAHAAMKPTLRRFNVNEKNSKHGERSRRAVVCFSSNNI